MRIRHYPIYRVRYNSLCYRPVYARAFMMYRLEMGRDWKFIARCSTSFSNGRVFFWCTVFLHFINNVECMVCRCLTSHTPLTSSWPHLRCDVGLEEEEYK